MPLEREEIVVGNPTNLETVADDLLSLSTKERRHRLSQVLDRGFTEVRLRVPLPPDVHGEWVVNDKVEIARLRALGYKVDDKYAIGNSLHSDGTDTPTIGDVVFMTVPMVIKDDIDAIARIKFIEANGTKGEKAKLLAEEKLYAGDMATETEIPAIVGGKTSFIGGDELKAASGKS